MQTAISPQTREQKKSVMLILLAFSTGRPRNGPRSYNKSASRNIACASLIGMRRGHIYESPVTYYCRAFYPNRVSEALG